MTGTRFDLIGEETSNDDQAVMCKRCPFAPTTADGRGFAAYRLLTKEPIRERREQMVRASLITAVGLICATMLAIGFGVVVPVSSVVGDVFDVLAVVSGVYFVGLLDGE
jgi:hypothetical protein